MTLTEIADKSSTVLLVIDKQAGYFNPQLVSERGQSLPDDAAKTLDNIDSFIESARRTGVEVIWTQMIENADDSPTHISQKILADSAPHLSLTMKGQPSFDFYGRTKPNENEKIITKLRYDAFSHTELADYLTAKGVISVVLVGGYATRCVLSTAVGANGNDLFVVVPRGLVLNQSIAQDELNTLYGVTDAVFGQTTSVDDLLAVWE